MFNAFRLMVLGGLAFLTATGGLVAVGSGQTTKPVSKQKSAAQTNPTLKKSAPKKATPKKVTRSTQSKPATKKVAVTNRGGKKQTDKISLKRVKSIVKRHFDRRDDYRDNDLITQADATAILKQLEKAGWKVKQRKTLTEALLPDGHFLVTTFASKSGKRFMRKVASNKQIYDRLDRLSQVDDGKEMLTQLLKLPDGDRYTKLKQVPGNPNLLDLLPKKRDGKVRRVKDYDEPTGKIYTQTMLVDALTELHKAAREKKK